MGDLRVGEFTCDCEFTNGDSRVTLTHAAERDLEGSEGGHVISIDVACSQSSTLVVV